MRIGLAISYFNEEPIVAQSLEALRSLDEWCLVQSGNHHAEAVHAALRTPGMPSTFIVKKNLAAECNRYELPARSLTRNYAAAAEYYQDTDVDYVVFATGDTLFLHAAGVKDLARRMERQQALLACAIAVGQDFHSADKTLEDLEAGRGGGRLQTLEQMDFMPQLFVVHQELLAPLSMPVLSNPWTTEQCLGDTVAPHMSIGQRYVFSETATGYADGVIYHAYHGK